MYGQLQTGLNHADAVVGFDLPDEVQREAEVQRQQRGEEEWISLQWHERVGVGDQLAARYGGRMQWQRQHVAIAPRDAARYYVYGRAAWARRLRYLLRVRTTRAVREGGRDVGAAVWLQQQKQPTGEQRLETMVVPGSYGVRGTPSRVELLQVTTALTARQCGSAGRHARVAVYPLRDVDGRDEGQRDLFFQHRWGGACAASARAAVHRAVDAAMAGLRQLRDTGSTDEATATALRAVIGGALPRFEAALRREMRRVDEQERQLGVIKYANH